MKKKKKYKNIVYPNELADKLTPKSLKKAITKKGNLTKQAIRALATSRVLRGLKADASIYKLLRQAKKRGWETAKDFRKGSDAIQRRITMIIQYDIILHTKEQAIQEFDNNKERTLCRWIASSADNPAPDHIQNYDKLFYLDDGIDGELPGERFGCQCGYELVDDDTRLIDDRKLIEN